MAHKEKQPPKSDALSILYLLLGIPYAFIIVMTGMSRAKTLDDIFGLLTFFTPAVCLCLFAFFSERTHALIKALSVIFLVVIVIVSGAHLTYFITH